jgi:hypothetical protein
MKFLISESGGIVNWNGDVNSLDAGVYFLVKKVETIRVVGGNSSKRREAAIPAINVEEKWHSSDVVDESSDAIAEIPNNDKRAGKIRYWQGLRYVENAEGKLERFAASDEPQLIEGKLFSGYYSAGKFQWNYSEPKGFIEEAAPAPIEPEPLKKKEPKAEKKNKKKPAEEITANEVNELNDLVENISTDSPFDEDAFLDDLAGPAGDSVCQIDSDKLSLIVTFDGNKYKKKFKSEKVAESQLEVFKSLLVEDVDMAKELLMGSMSTFTKF